MMSELLLELFSEEIPALMQKPALVAYETIFKKTLTDNNISFNEVKTYAGPRRITVNITGLPRTIAAQIVDIKGPRLNAPMQAIEGFCKSHNIDKTELKSEETYYIYQKTIPETPLSVILLELIPKAIGDYSWRKSMRWGSHKTRWVRPLKNILCLLDQEILPIKYGHLTANNITYGHRLTSELEHKTYRGQSLTISSASYQDYSKTLENHYVIVDHQQRQKMILDSVNEETKNRRLKISEDQQLLEEITGLVEYPIVLISEIPESDSFLVDKVIEQTIYAPETLEQHMGIRYKANSGISFIAKYDPIPKEILAAAMRKHQKYFSTLSTETDKMLPYFIFVSNNYHAKENENIKNKIIDGNQKVLLARLKDAIYSYGNDYRKPQELINEQLQSRIFYSGLGSLYDKQTRLARTITNLFEQKILTNPKLPSIIRMSEVSNPPVLKVKIRSDVYLLSEAARICKQDAVSDTIREYPHLQGVIGAGLFKTLKHRDGFHDTIYRAIKEHHKPSDAEDELPSNIYAKILALADKTDSLIGFMLKDVEVTSSSDRYGLRRLAIAIIRIIFYNFPSLPQFVISIKSPNEIIESVCARFMVLDDIINYTLESYAEVNQLKPINIDQFKVKLMAFIDDRIHYSLKKDYPEIAPFLKLLVPEFKTNISRVCWKLAVLRDTEKRELMCTTYKRIAGVVCNKKIGDSDSDLSNLNANKLTALDLSFKKYIFDDDIKRRTLEEIHSMSADELDELDELRRFNITEVEHLVAVNTYLDQVLINDPNHEIANNRYILLKQVQQLFLDFFNFDALL